MNTLPTTSTMVPILRSLAKLCVDTMTTEDEYGVENEPTCNINMFHVLTMMNCIFALLPNEKIHQDIYSLIRISNDNYDKNKKNKPKMFDQAKKELSYLLDYDFITKIEDEAIIYFACVLEVFSEKTNTLTPIN